MDERLKIKDVKRGKRTYVRVTLEDALAWAAKRSSFTAKEMMAALKGTRESTGIRLRALVKDGSLEVLCRGKGSQRDGQAGAPQLLYGVTKKVPRVHVPVVPRADAAPKVKSMPKKTSAPAAQSAMRRFVLNREVDSTGTSGIGVVAEGVQFSNGQVVIHWLSQLEAINVYANAVVLEKLHGHGGNTSVVWMDGATHG